jgi:aryl-alcohol dehydrogenase-like predicted oxidoreductase
MRRRKGRTESFLGQLACAPQAEERDRSRRRSPAPGAASGYRGGRTDLTRDVIAEAVDTSLARLRIDCIDLYQIHWPQRNVPMFGAKEFDPTKERAGSRHPRAGRGHGRDDQGGQDPLLRPFERDGVGRVRIPPRRERARPSGPVTIQNSYSLVSRSVDNDLAEVLFGKRCRCSPTVRSAGGILTGKYRGGAQPPNSRYVLFDDTGLRFRKPIVHEAVDAYAALAERLGVSLPQLALGYVRSRWHLGALLVGATSLAQLEANLAAASFDLDASMLEAIADVQVRYPNPAG